MGRVFIKLAYKGTNFFGWQIQPNEPTVQAEIERVLTQLNGNNEVKITGCGRTDTGVHASDYYAHCDIPFEVSNEKLKFKLNSMLSKDIVVHDILGVEKDAHARFDAEKRTYHYFIHQNKDPFIQNVSWERHGELDVSKMNEACLSLLKHEDFECFSKVKTEVNNFNCNVTNAGWVKSDKGYIFTITANRFLRNMVRAIVGTMVEIGEGKLSNEEFEKILDSKNRSEAGQSVPARGLFLAKIDYPYIKD
ncbi:MAG: tRNA pseudouridine(38-40) synthase TruA [Crocinitomix sp. MedPE-SWsnd]|nr:MAG: tRNA pseudouridine(38-40) synthase TruA [Crocinitomix sp. MedPE-SWsnd]